MWPERCFARDKRVREMLLAADLEPSRGFLIVAATDAY
jgi:hypothetical protein